MERENLLYRASTIEPIMRTGLLRLMEKHEIIGDVRGMGLLWALEIVQNRETKQSFPASVELPLHFYQILTRNGLVNFRAGNIVPISPPLTITEDELQFLFDALDKSLSELRQHLS